MKSKKLLLLLSVFALSSCDFLATIGIKTNSDDQTQSDTGNNQNTNNNQNNNNTNTGTEIVTPEIDDEDSDKPQNTPFSLENWTNFAFHDGNAPEHNQYWTFWYGDSENPDGILWRNPNESLEYSGPEFKKNCRIVSPLFNSWAKVECRFTFWFSSKTSTSYSATANQPQFKLESYDNNENLLSTEDIEITKSNVPNNNTPYIRTVYLRHSTATYFVLKWNNYIANGSSGYSAILCDVSLKGWQYE